MRAEEAVAQAAQILGDVEPITFEESFQRVIETLSLAPKEEHYTPESVGDLQKILDFTGKVACPDDSGSLDPCPYVWKYGGCDGCVFYTDAGDGSCIRALIRRLAQSARGGV